ncbi:beta-galactosidase, partial [Roseibium sp.]|uniref:beta-galactosidase n=1 Tax=Roseibium sp. TaxID=1936156 RepID=UPI003D097AD2
RTAARTADMVIPAPLPGMMRLWAWEAYAHGAEAVCYFRWRQAPFAQEQMHAGMLRPDNADAPALIEARKVAEELDIAPEVSAPQAPVALIFDYDADFAWSVQPHGKGLSYFQLVFDTYRALRKLGLSVDIVRGEARDFSGYRIVAAPGLIHMPQDLKTALAEAGALVVLGPRTAARTADMVIPVPLPPDIPGLEVTVARVESLRPDMPIPLKGGGKFVGYREELDGAADVMMELEDGQPAVFRQDHLTYVGGWGDETVLKRLYSELCEEAGIETRELSGGLRCRDTKGVRIWTNYGAEPAETPAGRIEAAGVLFEKL